MIAFQVIPIFYTVNVAFTNYSTGHILVEGRGDRRDPGQLARAAAGRQVVPDGAGPRRGRRARAAARRRGHRQHVRRDHRGAEPDRAEQRGGGRPRDRRAQRATRSSRAPSWSRSTASSRRSPSPRPARRRSGPRVWTPLSSSSRRCATTRSKDQFTRIERRGRVHATTARARSRPRRRGARARLEDEHRAGRTSQDPPQPARPRSVPARLRLDVRLRVSRRC